MCFSRDGLSSRVRRVRIGDKQEDTVTIGLDHGTYPTISLHLTPDEAAALFDQLWGALWPSCVELERIGLPGQKGTADERLERLSRSPG